MPTRLMFASIVILGATGCTREPRVLEPRTPPPATVPSVPVPLVPPPDGHGRLVIYPTDGPMRVVARADIPFVPPGRSIAPTRTGELCTAPCVVDLPHGHYRLYLTPRNGAGQEGGDIDDIDVGPGVNYFLRAPGKYESAKAFPPVPTGLLIAGSAMFMVGSVMLPDPDPSSDGGVTGVNGVGVGLLLGGLVVAGVGGILFYEQGRATSQQGASTFWRTEKP